MFRHLYAQAVWVKGTSQVLLRVQAVNSLTGLAFFLHNNTNVIKCLIKKLLKQFTFTFTFSNQNDFITSLINIFVENCRLQCKTVLTSADKPWLQQTYRLLELRTCTSTLTGAPVTTWSSFVHEFITRVI